MKYYDYNFDEQKWLINHNLSHPFQLHWNRSKYDKFFHRFIYGFFLFFHSYILKGIKYFIILSFFMKKNKRHYYNYIGEDNIIWMQLHFLKTWNMQILNVQNVTGSGNKGKNKKNIIEITRHLVILSFLNPL